MKVKILIHTTMNYVDWKGEKNSYLEGVMWWWYLWYRYRGVIMTKEEAEVPPPTIDDYVRTHLVQFICCSIHENTKNPTIFLTIYSEITKLYIYVCVLLHSEWVNGDLSNNNKSEPEKTSWSSWIYSAIYICMKSYILL